MDDAFNFDRDGQERAPPASDAELLKRALINEKTSPELLMYEGALVDSVEANMADRVRSSIAQCRKARGHR